MTTNAHDDHHAFAAHNAKAALERYERGSSLSPKRLFFYRKTALLRQRNATYTINMQYVSVMTPTLKHVVYGHTLGSLPHVMGAEYGRALG